MDHSNSQDTVAAADTLQDVVYLADGVLLSGKALLSDTEPLQVLPPRLSP